MEMVQIPIEKRNWTVESLCVGEGDVEKYDTFSFAVIYEDIRCVQWPKGTFLLFSEGIFVVEAVCGLRMF